MIGLASTAPAYSLAAVIGLVVVAVGVQAPAVLLASFVPMFFIAAAFFYMIGAGFLVLGAALMLAWRAGNPRGYFQRSGLEAVDPSLAGGR